MKRTRIFEMSKGNNHLKIINMKTIRFKTEKETENAVIELTIKGVKFLVTGRTEIVIL